MRSKLSPRALFSEAFAGILQRPGRTILTTLGTVLGVGAFVTVLGLTTTTSGQISKRFTALAATEVTVEDSPENPAFDPPFPANAEARARAINGVVHAGVYWTVPSQQTGPVTSVRLPGQPTEQCDIVAADPGLLPAANAHVASGRTFDVAHNDRTEQIAVLGSAIAKRLGVSRLDYPSAIFIGDIPFTVIGIIDDVQRRPELLLSIVVPRRTAEKLWPVLPGNTFTPKMLVETKLGAARTVADQLGLAIRPNMPQRLRITAPPDPHTLHDNVGTDLKTLFLLLATICLIIGAVGITNTTLVAVLERVPEIGLRRALGARKHHIAAQFIAESAAIGTIGGIIGTSLGIGTVITVAASKQWTPIMEPGLVLPAPLIGSLIGLLAGVYPALRATRVEPVEALRR